MNPSVPIPVVMDMKLRRPACVLLQATFGGFPAIVTELFHEESWLLSPTDDMRVVRATRAEWERIAFHVNELHPMRRTR